MFMKQSDYTFIKLYKNYNIFVTINRKYNQQFVNFFRIIKKVKRLDY